ncbi:MAG: hypothetical protein WKF78_13380 [Candidatus Limnocylindrales bacterium]
MPEDLLKFELIPEFVGRLPVMVTLDALTADDLVRVLTEPRNAVTRQFQKFLSLDKVDLVFTPGALRAAAEVRPGPQDGRSRACAPSWRRPLLEVMYDIPERSRCPQVHHHRGDDPRQAGCRSCSTKADVDARRRRDELRGMARRTRRECQAGRSRARSRPGGAGVATWSEPGLVWCDVAATRLFAWRRR